MNSETILYAVKQGDPDWAEQVITTKPDQIEQAKAWAQANGFNRFRVAEIDLDLEPDFRNVLNI